MKMAKTSKPELIQLFENMLWINSPKSWILKSVYFQNTLFVSMLIKIPDEEQYRKIRRSFNLDIIQNRSEDLWGMANDCVEEMKSEIIKK